MFHIQFCEKFDTNNFGAQAQAIAIGGEEDAKGKDGKGKDGKGKGFDKGKGNKGFDKGKGKDKSLGKGQLGPQGPPSQMPQMGNKGKGPLPIFCRQACEHQSGSC